MIGLAVVLVDQGEKSDINSLDDTCQIFIQDTRDVFRRRLSPLLVFSPALHEGERQNRHDKNIERKRNANDNNGEVPLKRHYGFLLFLNFGHAAPFPFSLSNH